ncbi:21915_t:CDS:2 [Cetraspora pellucida]|uniref:21915_t:CDS:1 n=1 Tax=Cetraspora pellucida TaxID=1433469 RepID=A0A9N9EMS0_9GLOM|nr:21915_t:CDS:2 [Cetraspora pellucida]
MFGKFQTSIIILKEIVQQLYDKVIKINTDKYIENELINIDFESNISFEDFENDPKE